MKKLAVALLALITVTVGCSTSGGGGETMSKFGMSESPVDAAVRNNTRTFKLYNKFRTILILDTILNDYELRKTWAREKTKSQKASLKEKSLLMAQEREAANKEVEFILALYTPEDEWNDLDDPETEWVVTLNPASDRVRPVAIEKIKPETLKIRDHLPFHKNFRTFYRVSFKKSSGLKRPYTLVVSSVLGSAEFNWDRIR